MGVTEGKIFVMGKDEKTIENVKKELEEFESYISIEYEVKPYLFEKKDLSSLPNFLDGKSMEIVTPFGRFGQIDLVKEILSKNRKNKKGEHLDWINMSWEGKKEYWAKKIVMELYENRMIKTWYRDKKEGWTLKSGIWSPFYVQLRLLPSFPELLKMAGQAIAEMIRNECPDLTVIVGVAMAGIPIATAVSVVGKIPACYTRKLEGKTIEEVEKVIASYGGHSIMEGKISNGDVIAILDDLVTKFDSKVIAIKQVEHEVKNRKLVGVEVKTIVVLVDREQGAGEIAEKNGYKLVSLIPFKSKALEWLKDVMHPKEHDVISEYLEDSDKFQDKEIQKKLKEAVV